MYYFHKLTSGQSLNILSKILVFIKVMLIKLFPLDTLDLFRNGHGPLLKKIIEDCPGIIEATDIHDNIPLHIGKDHQLFLVTKTKRVSISENP